MALSVPQNTQARDLGKIFIFSPLSDPPPHIPISFPVIWLYITGIFGSYTFVSISKTPTRGHIITTLP